MTAILRLLKNIFAGLFSSNQPTGSTSQVGSEGSTGNGVSNGNSINYWLVGILGVALLSSVFILGRCSVQPTIVQGPVTYLPGIPDTTYLPLPPTSGVSSGSHTTYTAELDTVYCVVAIPAYAEVEVIINEQYIKGQIRATAYPYIEHDSLKVTNQIEYNLQPKSYEITIHDTIPAPYPVAAEVPWIEHPATVATGVSLGWLALILILL